MAEGTRVRTVVKATSAIGAALLALGVAMPLTAFASTAIDVPCTGSGGGAAGLIAAINAANAGGGGTIYLAQGCTYTLSSPDNSNPMLGANGLPVIRSVITINGSGEGSGEKNQQVGESEDSGATIAGIGRGFRIFEVDGPSGNLNLKNLTLTKGAAIFGGGILNVEGAVTLNHSRVTGNTGAAAGGGIASGIVDPTHLGPIGTLTLNFSQVNGNTALAGGGGGIVNRAGTLTINHSQVNSNTSGGGGGGIASGPGNGGVAGSSTLTIIHSQVNNNVSTGGPLAGAGGVANGGLAVISHSEVNNNQAPGAPGGGIFNHGTMTLDQSEVNGNKAPADGLGHDGLGGGIANINFSAFFGAPSGVLTLNDSQVNNNSASGLGGGIFETGGNPDGSLGAPGGALLLEESKVTGNASGSGGGIYASAGSPVTLEESRVRHNTPDNCVPPGSITGCVG